MNTQTKEPEDRLADAKSQGQAQFESILEMVRELQRFEGDTAGGMQSSIDDARRAIEEDALSVEVRSDWYLPGARNPSNRADDTEAAPAEYRLLLCTGGPACQIVGTLSEHCEPETAVMQVQDWFTPWVEYRPRMPLEPAAEAIGGPEDKSGPETASDVMLAYARCFWFGE